MEAFVEVKMHKQLFKIFDKERKSTLRGFRKSPPKPMTTEEMLLNAKHIYIQDSAIIEELTKELEDKCFEIFNLKSLLNSIKFTISEELDGFTNKS